MLLLAFGVLFISSGVLCAPSDAVEVGVCNGDGCSALKSSIGAIEMARKELGCCTHTDCLPTVTTVLCAHDVVTHFFQDASTSKVCSDFNEQCEALRVVKMNLQLSSNILGCHEREERALISVPSTSTSKLLEDLLPQTVVNAFHNALPNAVVLAKVDYAVRLTDSITTGVALAGGLGHHKGNVYIFAPAAPAGMGGVPPAAPAAWGAVCADGFTQFDADTVCKQLGFSKAKRFWGVSLAGPVRGNQFGPVPPPYQILFGRDAAGLGCTAPNVRVQNCPNWAVAFPPAAVRGAMNCPSNLVAGVEC